MQLVVNRASYNSVISFLVTVIERESNKLSCCAFNTGSSADSYHVEVTETTENIREAIEWGKVKNFNALGRY